MKQWIKKWSPLWRPMIVPNLSVYASSACYYVVLSLIPTSLLLFSLLSLLPNIRAYDTVIRMLLPNYLAEIVRPLEQIRSQNPIGLVSVSGMVAIWSASKSVQMVRTGLNAAMDQTTQESFLRKRIRAMILLLLLFLLFLTILSLTLLGEGILVRLYQHGMNIPRWIQSLIQYRYFYLLIILSAALSGVFAILPKHKLSVRYCMIAGSFSSVICQGFSYIFSFYVNHITNYENLYGILGITILGMIWIRVCISVVLYAGRLAYLLQRKDYRPFTVIRAIISSD